MSEGMKLSELSQGDLEDSADMLYDHAMEKWAENGLILGPLGMASAAKTVLDLPQDAAMQAVRIMQETYRWKLAELDYVPRDIPERSMADLISRATRDDLTQ